MEGFPLPAELADEMCRRLGVTLPTDRAGVDALYRAWCRDVPFDSPVKALALREGRIPPGDDPTELCRRWLETGVGATCWGHISSLCGILGRAGADCAVALDRMLVDDPVDFHGFVVLRDSGRRFALDPVHVSDGLLPLEVGARGRHPVYGTGVDADGGRLIHWFAHPDEPDRQRRYTLLSTSMDRADVRAFCAVSSSFTGVTASRLHHRRCPPDAVITSRPADGGSLVQHRWDAAGHHRRTIDDVDEALDALGYHPSARPLLERAGLLIRRADGSGWVWSTGDGRRPAPPTGARPAVPADGARPPGAALAADRGRQ